MKPELGHVVEEFYIGRTKVRNCDDYCRDKTPEEVEKILARITQLAQDAYIAAQIRKQETASAEGDSKKNPA